jgi:opacity protein-like surface antigen
MLSGFAQLKVEIGASGNISYYQGEINPRKHFYSINNGLGGLIKYNFNNRLAFKFAAVDAKISGEDADFDNDFQKERNHKFSNKLVDVSGMMEMNFVKFGLDVKDYKFTPYITGGIGCVIASAIETGTSFTLPFGFGVKALVLERLTIGAEWTFRKTFTDDLDRLSNHYDYTLPGSYQNKQKSFDNNKDFYSFATIFISYRIIDIWQDCPAYR